MNDPIISPVAIYLVSTLVTLGTILRAIMGILMILWLTGGVLFVVYAVVEYDDSLKYMKTCITPVAQYIKKLLIITVAIAMGCVLIPKESYLYAIYASAFITPANIECVGGSVDKTIDKIFDGVAKVTSTREGKHE